MARCAKGGIYVKSDREILRAIQGQANEVRFGPGMVQNKDGSWSPKLDPRSNLRVDANGAITSEFGPEFEIIPGSPRAARLKPQRVRVEAVSGLVERLTEQEEMIDLKADATELATKADASDLTDLEAVVNGKAETTHGESHTSDGSDPIPMASLGTTGLVFQAETIAPLSGSVVVADISAKVDEIIAKLQAAGVIK